LGKKFPHWLRSNFSRTDAKALGTRKVVVEKLGKHGGLHQLVKRAAAQQA
jgi:hypothetical protein